MAVSGAALIGFVIAHLTGNLQIFQGQDKINAYALFLKSLGGLLWGARIGLLVMVGIHIWTSISLTRENCAARPVAYQQKNYRKASVASRTMIWSGSLILFFIIFHLLDFTFIARHPELAALRDSQGRHDVYSMMVITFQQPLIVLFYILAIFCLCSHLSHGISSMFQSLGFNSERSRKTLSMGGAVVAWLIFLGYASIPLGVLLGFAKLPPGVVP